MSGARCKIDLGQKTDPQSPRFRIALIRDGVVRTSIEGYLTMRGVELNRDIPPGWFEWLDDKRTTFQARCAEPPEDAKEDDGYQPFNYFVRAKLSPSRPGVHRAIGEDFFHETSLIPPLKPSD